MIEAKKLVRQNRFAIERITSKPRSMTRNSTSFVRRTKRTSYCFAMPTISSVASLGEMIIELFRKRGKRRLNGRYQSIEKLKGVRLGGSHVRVMDTVIESYVTQ